MNSAQRASRALVLLAMAMLAMSAALAAEVYRWVDANGVTQYGSTPPPGARATRVDVPPSPAPAPTTASRPAAPSAGGAGPMSAPRAASDAEPLATRLQRCAEAREQLDVLTQPMRVFRFDAAGERVYLPDEARAVEVGHLRDAVAARCAGLDSDAATRERRRQMLSFLQCRRATDQLRFLEQPSTRAGRQEVEEARHAVRNFCEGSRFPADTGTRGEYFNAPIARSGR